VNASGKQLNEGTAANVSSAEWFAGANLIEIAFTLKEDQQCSKTYVSPSFVFVTACAGLSTFASVSHVAQLGGGRRFMLASFLFQSRIYAPSRHLVFALVIFLSQATVYVLTPNQSLRQPSDLGAGVCLLITQLVVAALIVIRGSRCLVRALGMLQSS